MSLISRISRISLQGMTEFPHKQTESPDSFKSTIDGVKELLGGKFSQDVFSFAGHDFSLLNIVTFLIALAILFTVLQLLKRGTQLVILHKRHKSDKRSLKLMGGPGGSNKDVWKKDIISAAVRSIKILAKKHEGFGLSDTSWFPQQEDIEITEIWRHAAFNFVLNKDSLVKEGRVGTLKVDIDEVFSPHKRLNIGLLLGTMWFMAYRAASQGQEELDRFRKRSHDYVKIRDDAEQELEKNNIKLFKTSIGNLEQRIARKILKIREKESEIKKEESKVESRMEKHIKKLHESISNFHPSKKNLVAEAQHELEHDIGLMIHVAQEFIEESKNLLEDTRSLKGQLHAEHVAIEKAAQDLEALKKKLEAEIKSLSEDSVKGEDLRDLKDLLHQIQASRNVILSNTGKIYNHMISEGMITKKDKG